MLHSLRCGMIAMKREVAACKWRVFRGANVKLGNWRQVTVQIKISKFCNKKAGHMCVVPATHTETCTVTACRTAKVRKGGDFFYGKSSNENHTEGL